MTEKQQLQNLEFAAQKLIENPKKAIGLMRDNEGGRCCLGVMCDAARELGFVVEECAGFPEPYEFTQIFGIRIFQNFTINDQTNSLARHNDGRFEEDFEKIDEKSHKQIGEMLLEFVNSQK